MNRQAPKTVRGAFSGPSATPSMSRARSCRQFWRFSFVLRLLIGIVEGWSVGVAVYFTFVIGLTIGYGDIVPRQALARALAIGIGVSGLFLTGLIAGIAVYAMRTALSDRDTD